MHLHADTRRLPGIPGARRTRWAVRLAAATVAGLAMLATGLAALPAGAAGTTLYVDRSASCPGLGLQAAPYCTIGAAAAAATAGTTVRVAAGTYPETVTPARSGASGSPIVYDADPGATVRGGTNGFTIASRSWVTVRGFTVADTVREGILVSGSSSVTVSGNRVTSAGDPVSGRTAQGIRLTGTTDSLVQGNTADHNSEAGILLAGGSTRNRVAGNESFANARGYTRAAPGIDVRAPGNSVTGNRSHDNEDTGIQSYTGGDNTLVANNVAWSNGDHGIDDLGVTGQRIVGNTVYGNVASGINLEGASSGATVENNVSVDNGIGSPRTKGNIRVDSTSTPGATVDYNLVSLGASAVMYTWGTTGYPSLAAFRAATGQEPHGIQADPRFAGARDFHLLAGSPAVDSANSGQSGQQAVDAEDRPRFDDPGVANTGAGPRAFDDRGAFERQSGSQGTGGGGNLVANPGFERDLTGWTGTGIARVPGGRTGFAARLGNPGSAAASCTLNDSPNWVARTSAGSYTGSLWVRADAAGAGLKLRLREYSGQTLVKTSTTTATLGTAWQQVTVVHAVSSAGTTLDLNAYVSSAPPGTCFYADDASITGP